MQSYQIKVRDNQLLLFGGTGGALLDARALAEGEIDALVAEISRYCQPPAPDIVAAGKRLYQWLDDPSRRWLKPRLGDPDGIALYVDVEGLRQLPWELLHDGNGFLCARRRAPFTPVYHNPRTRSGSISIANRPLRVLFMACAPESLAALSFEHEEALILEATETLRGQQLALVVEESGSRQGLSENFRHYGRRYFDVLHLSGHADFAADGKPVFAMENALGEADLVTAVELAEAMDNAWPRLVFLSGCRTGQDAAAALPSMCEALVAAGAPAVLGWSQPIGDATAASAAAIIYTELAQGNAIYSAIANARSQLHQKKPDEWYMLRLYADAAPLEPLVTVPATEGREQLFWRKAETEFLDARRGSAAEQHEVCPAAEFVGRRRLLQRALRCLRATQGQEAKYAEGLLLSGIGGYGKSSTAARLCQRMSGYQRLVIVGALDEPGLLGKLQDQLSIEAAVAALNQSGLTLKQRLRNLFQHHLEKPLLLVLDDFEHNCEGYPNDLRLDNHQAVLLPEALNTLAALLEAIRQSGSETRLIVTCRYRFVPPAAAGARLAELSLAHFNATELRKKLARLSAWKGDSKVDVSLRERALELAAGNPRLLERLDKVLSNTTDNDQLAVGILDALEAKTVEFREEILLRHLLQQQSEQGRQLLARLSVCQLPIDRDAVIAIGSERTPDEYLDAAAALGLIEVGSDASNTRRYCVPGLLTPLLGDTIKADERYQAYQRAARHLYQIWWKQPGEAGTETPESQALEVHRLAMQAGEGSIAAEIAIAIAAHWKQQSRYREAKALCQTTLGLIKHHDLYRLLAVAKAVLGQPHEALHDYRQSLETFESIGDVQGKAVTLHGMAGVLAQQGEVEGAMKLWQQSLEICESIGDVQGKAATLHGMAGILAQQGEVEEAMKLWQQSLEICESIGDVKGKAATLHNMAGVLAQQGEVEEAMKLWQQSLEIEESIGNVKGKAATLHEMAGVLAQQGEVEGAMKLWQQSLETFESIGDVKGKAVTLHQMARVLAQQSKPEEAMKLWQQSLEIFESIGDVKGKAATLHQMAGVLAQQGEVEGAMKLWQQSLETFESIGDVQGKAATLHQMAGVLAQQGEVEGAMKLWQQSLEIDESIGDVQGKAATLHAMAGVLAQQGKPEEAMKLWQQSLEITESIGDVKGKAATLASIGVVLAAHGKPEKGMELLQQALAIFESIGNVQGKAATLHEMAGVLAQQGEPEKAMKLWQQSLEIKESIGDVQGKAATLNNMAMVLAKQGEPEEAMKLFQQALRIKESIGDIKGKAEILHNMAGVLSEQGKPEVAIKLHRLKLTNFRCFKALEVGFDGQFTVLVGRNGAGKTCVLDAIASAFGTFVGAFDYGATRHIAPSDARRQRGQDTYECEAEYPVTIEADGRIKGTDCSWRRDLTGPKRKTTIKDAAVITNYAKELQQSVRKMEEDNVTLPLIAYYGTGRLWKLHKNRSKRNWVTEGRTAGYEDCLSVASNYRQLVDWFSQASFELFLKNDHQPQSKKNMSLENRLACIKSAVHIVLEDQPWIDLKYSAAEKDITMRHQDSGAEIPLSRLSDGIRTMVTMVADIAFRCTKLNPHLSLAAAQKTQGIVLIDEVDMYLHPEWQQRVVPSLMKAFPLLQFIVTTHSPQVLSTIRQENIRILEGDMAESPPGHTYLQPSHVVLAEAMAVNPQPPVPEAKDLHRLTLLVESGYSKREEARGLLQDLKESLGADHPQIQKIERTARRIEEMNQ